MNIFFLALLCSAGIGNAQGVDHTPVRSLAKFLLVEHPMRARGIRLGRTGAIGNRHRVAGMLFQDQYRASETNVNGVPAGFPDDGVEEATDPDEYTPPPPQPNFDVRDLPGISAPLGFFDPLGFTNGASEGKIRFYREVELKHGRVAMLAALGFAAAEQLHPMLGGSIDVPSYRAYQETWLFAFWGALFMAICNFIPEIPSMFTFNSPFSGGEWWSIRSDYDLGNLGFDPLNLKPTNPRELKDMQTKELNNGRLAMLAIVGMIAQEYVTGAKLF